MADFSFDRRAFFTGAREILPLGVPGIPFGLVLGVLTAEAGVDRLAGWSAAWIILAGAAHLATVELLAENASAAVVLTTVAFINSRHAMYSAALRPKFAGFPRWFRAIGPYFLIDQVFALASVQVDELDDRHRMWHYLGSGAVLWLLWMTAITTGLFLGDVIEPDWQLTFAVPLLFGGLMLLSISNRPGVVAAVVGAGVALATAEFPQGSGVIVAIFCGVTAAAIVDARTEAAT